MKKYTPSPWQVFYRDDNLCMSMTVIAPKGSLGEARNIGRLEDQPFEMQQEVIAITWHQLQPWAGIDAFDRDEKDGNDTLMAMASEMFEVLLQIKEFGHLRDATHHVKERVDELLGRMEA